MAREAGKGKKGSGVEAASSRHLGKCWNFGERKTSFTPRKES